jgi:hypothetical protein
MTTADSTPGSEDPVRTGRGRQKECLSVSLGPRAPYGCRGDAGHVPASECEGRVSCIFAARHALPLVVFRRAAIPTVSVGNEWRRSPCLLLPRFRGHHVIFRSSPTVFADIAMPGSTSIRIRPGKPPSAMCSAPMLLGLRCRSVKIRRRSDDCIQTFQISRRS